MEKEIWKDIIGTSYEASNSGFIRHKVNKNIQLTKDDRGYIRCYLYYNMVNGKKIKPRNTRVHRVIAELFIPNPLNKSEVNHINGIKDDNRVENLEWVTKSENMLHAYRTKLSYGIGNYERGSKNISSKLTEEDVIEIRNKKNNGERLVNVFNLYKDRISIGGFNHIWKGDTWKHIEQENQIQILEDKIKFLDKELDKYIKENVKLKLLLANNTELNVSKLLFS